MDFSCEIEEIEHDQAKLKLSGSLDEYAELPSGDKFAHLSYLAINFERVTFINSVGIKAWITFITEIENYENLQVQYIRCPRIIVDQINLIDGFLPKNGKVQSVFIPVFCNECENSFEVFQDIDKLEEEYPDVLNRVNARDCNNYPRCINEFEVDIVKSQFFNFLKDQ